MSGPTRTPVTHTTCLTGFIRRAESVGFIQRGTHRLVDNSGHVVAALHSQTVNLFALEGQFVTVCGVNEGQIEGVTSLLVTQAFPSGNATLLRGIHPQWLFTWLVGNRGM